ncbi:hypothetical protein HPB50_009027 [Hyalomma asiaticum]|uniref:Uncharacterized protein n=1 Tax=Hyalomma asiaticum TaxID=266040 RepID=A0ACB7SUV2_HYAAI|nr:hypothetical protein HPB50_009027 [Hyalomma asiaticum]
MLTRRNPGCLYKHFSRTTPLPGGEASRLRLFVRQGAGDDEGFGPPAAAQLEIPLASTPVAAAAAALIRNTRFRRVREPRVISDSP